LLIGKRGPTPNEIKNPLALSALNDGLKLNIIRKNREMSILFMRYNF